MVQRIARSGEYCPSAGCRQYGKVGQGNIIRFGTTRRGVQRYRCKACGGTFTQTRGTVFYRRRIPHKDILESLALLADGVRISSLARAKGVKADTILDWLREAVRHAEAVEEVLLRDYRLGRAQIDALWAYVGHKDEKGGQTPASTGAARS